MRIAIIHDWVPDITQELTWKDGLAAAVRELSKRHEVKFFTIGDETFTLPHPYFPIYVCKGKDQQVSQPLMDAVKEFDADVHLFWSDNTRPHAIPLAALGKPQANCFAGGDPQGHTMQAFDHFFVESAVYKQRFELLGRSVSTAFGTNTELFQPLSIDKKFDVIFPATFAAWKRHHLLTESTRGLRTLCTGFMYTAHERECWEYPMKHGVLTVPHVSADTLRWLYATSKVCVITSHGGGGSQRTALEAMAMNIPVVGMDDSDKICEYLNESSGFIARPEPTNVRMCINDALKEDLSKWNTRDYILSKWSHVHYADALEAGLKNLLS